MSSNQRPSHRSNKPVVPADQVQRDLERFAAALKASEKADSAKRSHERAERDAAASLADARRDLERAVEAVRAAKASRRGVADADAAWKVAKARVIELETGTRPAWAPAVATPEPAADGDLDASATADDQSFVGDGESGTSDTESADAESADTDADGE